MDWTSIIVALITATGAGAGSLYGIKKSNSLIDYKIDELTREVREHNNFARRMPVVEEQIKVVNHRLEDLEELERK